MTAEYFLHGAFGLPGLREALAEADRPVRTAMLHDHSIVTAGDDALPLLLPEEGAEAPGLLLQADDEAVERLEFLAEVCGMTFALVTVETAHGAHSARALVPRLPPDQPVSTWQPETWLLVWGQTVVATMRDALALNGRVPAERIAARFYLMMVRASSRVRAAADPAPTVLRRHAVAGDVDISAFRQPYARFFAVEEYDLRHVRFDGSMAPEMTRAVFLSGDAVTVLPYDPVRDRVLLIEQFRAGPLARGDAQPWMLETIAGRIDPGEGPEESARREALEEAGLAIGPMHFTGSYYPSPGAKAEYLYSYLAVTDLPDGAAGTHGLAEEAEDIRGHLVSFDQLMELADSGEINNGPLLISVMWLARHRERLRRGA